MTGVALLQAGVRAPALAFLPDDVYPFDSYQLLLGKLGWLHGEDCHRGVEVVDSTGRRWEISGEVRTEPRRRRWWQFGRVPEERWDLEAEPLEPASFEATHQRVVASACSIFDETDEALAAIRSAEDMAQLSAACFQITVRAQGLRILAGRTDIPIRSAAEVARRVLVSLSVVRTALYRDWSETIGWLLDHDLADACSPSEQRWFRRRRFNAEEHKLALWKIEDVAALLWALDLASMPGGDDSGDIEAIAALVPPTAPIEVAGFIESAALRPATELAAMAEQLHRRYSGKRAGDASEAAYAAYLRHASLQCVLNPNRLNWE